jgi:hypothetical protein
MYLMFMRAFLVSQAMVSVGGAWAIGLSLCSVIFNKQGLFLVL